MVYDDPECTFSASFTKTSMDEILYALDAKRIQEMGCHVIKHPGCCVLCAMNDNCWRLPVHFRCRCRPSFYFMLDIIS